MYFIEINLFQSDFFNVWKDVCNMLFCLEILTLGNNIDTLMTTMSLNMSYVSEKRCNLHLHQASGPWYLGSPSGPPDNTRITLPGSPRESSPSSDRWLQYHCPHPRAGWQVHTPGVQATSSPAHYTNIEEYFPDLPLRQLFEVFDTTKFPDGDLGNHGEHEIKVMHM